MIRNYAFFLVSSFLKLGLFYFIARKYNQLEFIRYNVYLYCSDIILVLVSSGTYTYFALKKKIEHQLETALLFENLAAVGVMLFIFLLKVENVNVISQSISLTVLFLLTIGRVNNQIFSRHFLLFRSIPRSLLNDGLGNYLWIAVALICLIYFPSQKAETLLGIWIVFLFTVNGFNYWSQRERVNIRAAFTKESFGKFMGIYLMAFQFILLEKTFFNFEKIIAVSKFKDIDMISTYVFSSKIIGYLMEVTTAFTGIVLANNLVKLDVKKSKFFNSALLVNSVAFILIFIFVYVFSPFLLNISGKQMSAEYLPLLFFIILLYALNNIHALKSIYFQRHHKLKYLNIMAACQIIMLAILYFFVENIYWYIGLQVIMWTLMVIIDFIYRNFIEKNDSEPTILPLSSTTA